MEESRFILNEDFKVLLEASANPLTISNRFEQLNNKKEYKDLDVNSQINKVLEVFNKFFPDVNYLSKSDKISVINLYCSAIYLQIERLKYKGFNVEKILSSQGNLSGISKKNFTKKDFMSKYVTGGKKPIWGGAYLRKERIKGKGEIVYVLTKASGELVINLNIPRELAIDLAEKIENAGVSSFYIGKKGLAYVTDIRI